MECIFTDSEIEKFRTFFPITEKFIYLDHAGIAPISLTAVDKVNDFLNLASRYGVVEYDTFMDQVESVRSKFSRLINARSDEIAFVKNTSHGLSLLANGIKWEVGDNIIIIEKEFPSNVYPWLNLDKSGVEIREIPFTDGRVNIRDIEKSIDIKTRLLTISSVQFTNGFRADLKAIGELSKRSGFYFCVDAIQGLGIVPIDVRDYHIDFLSADGHKWLLSPEGTGIIFCSRRICSRVEPVILGWKSVIHEADYEIIDFTLKDSALKFEEGSFNVMGITALGGSLDLILEIGVDKIFRRIQYLGDKIIELAKKRNFDIKTPLLKEERGGIISFRCGIDPYKIKEYLRNNNIIVNVRNKAIRVSPHFYNTVDEITRLFDSIDDFIGA